MTADKQPTGQAKPGWFSTDRTDLLAELRQTPPGVLERPARRDEVTASGRILLGPSLWPTKREPQRVGFLRYRWEIVDNQAAPGEEPAVLASGHSPGKKWAWRRADAAQKRIYKERLEAAAEVGSAEGGA
jgi:hypothetical protein